ncbi:MAG: hypothetical protein K9M57_07275 [Phycisphaerae bacterium]|nr:hypothetical protein [Phycisphaerae bacterium]
MILRKIVAIVMLGSFLGGCNLLELPVYALFGQSYKKVKAEYTGLKGKKVAIIIAMGPLINYDYPDARLNVALAVGDLIKKNVDDVTLIDQNQIENYQNRYLDWLSMPMSELGTHFKADRVLYIDLYEYTMHDESSVNLLRGRLNGSLYIYDMESRQQDRAVYNGDVKTQYPKDHPEPLSEKALHKIRFNSIVLFADGVAKKFYNHEIKL